MANEINFINEIAFNTGLCVVFIWSKLTAPEYVIFQITLENAALIEVYLFRIKYLICFLYCFILYFYLKLTYEV